MTALADQLTRTAVPDPDEQAMTLPSELPQEVPADPSERHPYYLRQREKRGVAPDGEIQLRHSHSISRKRLAPPCEGWRT